MILSVTLNIAVDRSYVVEDFRAGEVFRSTEYWVGAGGKGINVARVLRALDAEVLVLGFAGGRNGEQVQACLREEGIPHRFTPIAGESRVCITVMDPHGERQTVINEAGPRVSAEEAADYLSGARTLLPELAPGSLVSMAGSLPVGATDSLYSETIRLARRHGLRSVVDTSGDALPRAAAACPWMLKCNAQEWAALEGRQPGALEEAAAYARDRVGAGTEWVVVTLGRLGAVLVGDGSAWAAAPPPVRTVNAVGSGDAFLAGLLWAFDRGVPPDAALAWGVAAGAANAEVRAAAGCSGDRIRQLRQDVRVRQL